MRECIDAMLLAACYNAFEKFKVDPNSFRLNSFE